MYPVIREEEAIRSWWSFWGRNAWGWM